MLLYLKNIHFLLPCCPPFLLSFWMRERDRERERERDRQTDRQTDRERDRQTDRQRQTEKKTDRGIKEIQSSCLANTTIQISLLNMGYASHLFCSFDQTWHHEAVTISSKM